eukprot:scaffold139_cov325-Pavlova_lutheri.AAC.69
MRACSLEGPLRPFPSACACRGYRQRWTADPRRYRTIGGGGTDPVEPRHPIGRRACDFETLRTILTVRSKNIPKEVYSLPGGMCRLVLPFRALVHRELSSYLSSGGVDVLLSHLSFVGAATST